MPPLTTADFDGVACPPDLQHGIVNRLLGGAPFARSLDPLPVRSGLVAWPVARPQGGGWTAEGSPLPQVDLGSTSYKVVAKKLSGAFPFSNELIGDAAYNIAGDVGDVVRDHLGPQLDAGVIHGGPDEEDSPIGVWEIADAVDDAELWAGIWTAVGELGDDGGGATHVALRPSTLAAEASRLDANGRPLYADGLVEVGGLTFVGAPGLEHDECLVYDSTRVRLIVRRDFAVEFDASAGFLSDVTWGRVIGRFAAAVPDKSKAIRKLTIAGAPAPGSAPEPGAPAPRRPVAPPSPGSAAGSRAHSHSRAPSAPPEPAGVV